MTSLLLIFFVDLVLTAAVLTYIIHNRMHKKGLKSWQSAVADLIGYKDECECYETTNNYIYDKFNELKGKTIYHLSYDTKSIVSGVVTGIDVRIKENVEDVVWVILDNNYIVHHEDAFFDEETAKSNLKTI